MARPWGKRDLRFFLLGALLPDFFARLESLALDLLQVNLFADYAMGGFSHPTADFSVFRPAGSIQQSAQALLPADFQRRLVSSFSGHAGKQGRSFRRVSALSLFLPPLSV